MGNLTVENFTANRSIDMLHSRRTSITVQEVPLGSSPSQADGTSTHPQPDVTQILWSVILMLYGMIMSLLQGLAGNPYMNYMHYGSTDPFNYNLYNQNNNNNNGWAFTPFLNHIYPNNFNANNPQAAQNQFMQMLNMIQSLQAANGGYFLPQPQQQQLIRSPQGILRPEPRDLSQEQRQMEQARPQRQPSGQGGVTLVPQTTGTAPQDPDTTDTEEARQEMAAETSQGGQQQSPGVTLVPQATGTQHQPEQQRPPRTQSPAYAQTEEERQQMQEANPQGGQRQPGGVTYVPVTPGLQGTQDTQEPQHRVYLPLVQGGGNPPAQQASEQTTSEQTTYDSKAAVVGEIDTILTSLAEGAKDANGFNTNEYAQLRQAADIIKGNLGPYSQLSQDQKDALKMAGIKDAAAYNRAVETPRSRELWSRTLRYVADNGTDLRHAYDNFLADRSVVQDDVEALRTRRNDKAATLRARMDDALSLGLYNNPQAQAPMAQGSNETKFPSRQLAVREVDAALDALAAGAKEAGGFGSDDYKQLRHAADIIAAGNLGSYDQLSQDQKDALKVAGITDTTTYNRAIRTARNRDVWSRTLRYVADNGDQLRSASFNRTAWKLWLGDNGDLTPEDVEALRNRNQDEGAPLREAMDNSVLQGLY